MAGLHFDITGDNSNFLRKLREVETGVTNTSKEIEKNGLGIEDMFNKMTKAAAAFGAGFTAKELIQNIIQVRGEFQQLEVAFTTMLGSSEKANVLMAQLTETAAKTPFDLQGVANGARQLLAYGTAMEDVNDTLVRLGNIAAGLSIPLNDLVYLYGTTMTQGRLYTQDLNQFTGRGIPMIRELAKEFGVAESEIKSMVEAGQIGFPEVQKVINNLTNEGGMFFNLMQEQSKTITGQISNIGDSFSMMLNDIGKANEGIINDALSSVSYLIENYETVGKTMLEIVGTYGAYKAALITITALQKVYSAVLAQSALNQSLAAASGITLSNAEALAATRTKLLQVAQAALNKTLLANPYVAVAAAVAALGLGIYKLITYQNEAEKAQERLNDEFSKTEVAALNEMSTLRELNRQLTEAKTGTDEWFAIKEKIVKGYSKYLSGIDEEIDKTGSLAGKYKELEEAIRNSVAAQNYSNFARQEENIYNSVREENLTKVYEAFTKKYGEEGGLKIYRNWLNWLDSGLDIPIEIQKIFNNVSTGWGESANTLLFEIRRQAEIRDKNLEDYRNKFFIQEPSSESTTENIFTTEGKSISQLEEEIKNAKTKLESLKKAFANGNGTKEAIEQQEAYIKSLQDTVLEREKDLKVISQVEAQISKLKKAQKETVYGSEEYNALQSRIDTLSSKLPKTKSDKAAEDKQAKEQKEAEQKLVDELLELRKKNQEKEISLWEEGKDKKLKQINYYYEEQKKEIKKKEKELSELNKVAKIEPSKLNENGLTTEQQEDIDTANRLNEKNKNKQTKEILDDEINAMNDYLAAYGNYYEKRNAIIAQGESRKLGKNEWEQKSIDEETKRALSDLDIEANKSTSAISKLFDDMRQHTVADMHLIANEAERAFQFLQSGEWDENKGLEFGMTKETFDTLRKSPEELERIRKGIDNVRNSADQSETGFNKLANGLKKVFDAGSNTKKLQDGLEEIRSGLSEVLSVAQFLSDTFSNLGEAFGSDTLSGIAEGINVAMDGLNSAMQGAEAGAIFGPIGSAAGAAIGLVSSLASSIAKIHDAKNEKRIQKLQDQVDTLDRSYEKLGKSIETAYGKSASSLIEDQNKLLEQQKVLIQNQIKEEQDKKNTDSDRIKEWENQIDEINNLISDNKEKAIDVIFGEDLKSAIDNFAEAYADAWASGENRAKSAKDVVKQMMQQMVTESIKAAIKSSNKMEEIRTKLQQFYADNVLSQWEQDYINNMAEQLQQEIDAQFGWADSLMGESSTTEQKSTAGGFETMSQDTATELNGRFTALQLSGEEIKNQMISAVISLNSLLSVSTNSNSILNNILNQHVITNSYLEDIAKYTKLLIDIKSDIAQVNRNTKDL
jgi:tape measure domain-containing protein